MCNHGKFLEETELACRRIARSANEGTTAQAEWVATAQVLLERRREHVRACDKCSEDK